MTEPTTPGSRRLAAFVQAVDPEAGQMLQARSFQLDEIARVFAVPRHLVGSGPRLGDKS